MILESRKSLKELSSSVKICLCNVVSNSCKTINMMYQHVNPYVVGLNAHVSDVGEPNVHKFDVARIVVGNISWMELDFIFYETDMNSSKCAYTIRRTYNISLLRSFVIIHLFVKTRYTLIEKGFVAVEYGKLDIYLFGRVENDS